MKTLKKLFTRSIFVSLLLLLFSSCSVIKRHYTKGFYVSKKSSDKNFAKNNISPTIKSFYKEPKNVNVLTAEKQTLTAQAPTVNKRKEPLAIVKNISSLIKINSLTAGCDTLFLRDGTVIAAKVSEINESEIKYTYCTGNNSAVHYIYKVDVDHIIYSNGTKETFKASISPNTKPALSQTEKPYSKFAVTGFIMSVAFYLLCLAVLIFALASWGGGVGFATAAIFFGVITAVDYLLALIFSIIGITETTGEKKYKGIGLAIAGVALCAIPLLIFLKSYLHI